MSVNIPRVLSNPPFLFTNKYQTPSSSQMQSIHESSMNQIADDYESSSNQTNTENNTSDMAEVVLVALKFIDPSFLYLSGTLTPVDASGYQVADTSIESSGFSTRDFYTNSQFLAPSYDFKPGSDGSSPPTLILFEPDAKKIDDPILETSSFSSKNTDNSKIKSQNLLSEGHVWGEVLDGPENTKPICPRPLESQYGVSVKHPRSIFETGYEEGNSRKRYRMVGNFGPESPYNIGSTAKPAGSESANSAGSDLSPSHDLSDYVCSDYSVSGEEKSSIADCDSSDFIDHNDSKPTSECTESSDLVAVPSVYSKIECREPNHEREAREPSVPISEVPSVTVDSKPFENDGALFQGFDLYGLSLDEISSMIEDFDYEQFHYESIQSVGVQPDQARPSQQFAESVSSANLDFFENLGKKHGICEQTDKCDHVESTHEAPVEIIPDSVGSQSIEGCSRVLESPSISGHTHQQSAPASTEYPVSDNESYPAKEASNEINIGRSLTKQEKEEQQYGYSKLVFPITSVDIPFGQNKARSSDYDPNMHKDARKQLFRDQSLTMINRKRYIRHDIAPLIGIHPGIVYKKNKNFSTSMPYSHEFIRITMKSKKENSAGTTRCGSCAYCEKLHFFNLENSAYLFHLAYHHGISAKNYLYPDGLDAGLYRVAEEQKENRVSKSRFHDRHCVICPKCLKIIKTRTSITTAETVPLAGFLRHFKDMHQNNKNPECLFNESSWHPPRPG